MRILCLLILSISSAFAQSTITGYVRDASSGEALPAASLQIEGTYQGAITNREGRYILKIERLPSVILIRYIGYESKRVTINSDFPTQVDIELKPSPIEMQNVVITGEDPAIILMRNVIAKKQRWFGKLKNFKADMYSRLSLENDSGIVMLSESLGDMYWDRIKGIRAVLKSKRTTKNVDPKDMVFSPDDAVVNFYDDDVTIQDSRFVGPTHPNALSYYDFKLIGQRNLDGQIVYDIRVNTKSKLQPTFVGTISVLDADSALIAVDLKPSEFAIFPMPIRQWDVAYKQQFSNFGREYWLPVDIRMNGLIKIGLPGLEFPSIKYGQLSAFNDYSINQTMPDSLYKQKRLVVVDSIALQKPKQFDSARVFIPLSEREDSAYAEIKRGDSFGKAFKPTGILSRYVKMEDEYNDSIAAENAKPKSAFKKFSNDLSPQLGFNRVEGGRLGLKYEHEFNRSWKASIRGGYTTALKDPFYGAGAEYHWGRRFVHFIKVSFYDGVTPRFDSDNYAVWMGQMLPLTGFRDYYDYYKAQEIRVTAGFY
ncbi:carboxypeptidase-like regulatory domain-containing protein, partial [bacterium]|nr:carboxypeptidase-like regulatory domain-containing protein [bacterium]